jgi:hypothetical protein
MALSRVLERNSLGNWLARYVNHGRSDHFAHAEAYCAVTLHWGSRGYLHEAVRRGHDLGHSDLKGAT